MRILILRAAAGVLLTGCGAKFEGVTADLTVRFEDDGRSFSCTQISETDETMANWIPSITRPGPFHPVDNPVILYTHGHPNAREGEGCKATHETEIYAVFVEG